MFHLTRSGNRYGKSYSWASQISFNRGRSKARRTRARGVLRRRLDMGVLLLSGVWLSQTCRHLDLEQVGVRGEGDRQRLPVVRLHHLGRAEEFPRPAVDVVPV